MKTISKRRKEKSKLTKDEWREYTKTVWHIANISHPHHPAVFPPEIPKRLIKLFTFHGDTVLDPFSGTGSTAEVALALSRRAVCVDQSKRYVEIAKARCKALGNGYATALNIRCGDSRDLRFLRNGSIGLVVTSPPYWNKADYGRGPANLGRTPGYRDFIESLRPVFRECHRVLMPGRKLCVITANVNQHTDFGLLCFPIAADLIRLLREIGFVMINEIIWNKDGTGGKWGSWGKQRPIFGSYPYPPNFLFKTVHEYILVFAKQRSDRISGPKVVPLAQLMGSKDGWAPNTGNGMNGHPHA